MTSPRRSPHSGFTLVELLVVAAVMAVFFGLTLAASRPEASQEVSRSAQSLVSAIIASQSKALGNSNGAAVVFDSGTTSSTPGICTTVYAANVGDPLVGYATNIAVSAPGRFQAALTLNGGSDDAGRLRESGYRIMFGGSGVGGPSGPYQPPSPWFSIERNPPPQASGTTATVSCLFRTNDGQTAFNTTAPQVLFNSTSPFRAAMYPQRAETLLALPKRVVIDYRFSGIGHEPSAQFGNAAPVGDVTLSLNSIGAVHEVIQNASARLVAEPVFFLLANRDSALAGTALADDTSVWVAISPSSGRVVSARNVPQSGSNEANIRAARALASAAVLGGK